MSEPKLAVFGTGKTVAAGSTSVANAIPNYSDSTHATPAHWVRVVCDENSAFVKFGQSTVVATTNDICITTNPQTFYVGPNSYFAVLKNGTNTANVNVTPLGN